MVVVIGVLQVGGVVLFGVTVGVGPVSERVSQTCEAFAHIHQDCTGNSTKEEFVLITFQNLCFGETILHDLGLRTCHTKIGYHQSRTTAISKPQ